MTKRCQLTSLLAGLALLQGCVIKDILPDVKSRTVEIIVLDSEDKPIPDKDGTTSKCGVGLILGPKTILTAGHIVDDIEPQRGIRSSIRLRAPGRKAFTVSGAQFETFRAEGADAGRIQLKQGELGVKFDDLGQMTADDVIENPNAFVVSFHPDECQGIKETQATYDTATATQLSGPQQREGKQVFRLSENLGGGYSGSPVVSRRLGVVVGIYIAGDQHGYATPLDTATSLFDGGPEPRVLRRVRSVPQTYDLAVAASMTRSPDSAVDQSYFQPTAVFRYRLPLHRSPNIWLTLGAQVGHVRFARRQVVADYPGGADKVAAEMIDDSFSAAPLVGLRFEPFARWHLQVEPLPYWTHIWGDDQATDAFSIGAQVTLAFRLFPDDAGLASTLAVSPFLGGFYGRTLLRPSVNDYRFNPLGERTLESRQLGLPTLGGRLGMEVTL